MTCSKKRRATMSSAWPCAARASCRARAARRADRAAARSASIGAEQRGTAIGRRQRGDEVAAVRARRRRSRDGCGEQEEETAAQRRAESILATHAAQGCPSARWRQRCDRPDGRDAPLLRSLRRRQTGCAGRSACAATGPAARGRMLRCRAGSRRRRPHRRPARGAQRAPARGRDPRRGAAAHPRRRRLGQDARAHPPHRLARAHRARARGRDPRDHVHQQGRAGDARARRAAARPLDARRCG